MPRGHAILLRWMNYVASTAVATYSYAALEWTANALERTNYIRRRTTLGKQIYRQKKVAPPHPLLRPGLGLQPLDRRNTDKMYKKNFLKEKRKDIKAKSDVYHKSQDTIKFSHEQQRFLLKTKLWHYMYLLCFLEFVRKISPSWWHFPQCNILL